ncbi:MAG: hypothetical protein GY808_18085 [Gammaproteobacteria bacterium]|nr:hypothetical protein [Gammaproteobacteria bacterium]
MSQSTDNEIITQLASELKAVHEPERDLWPVIEEQIRGGYQEHQTGQWMPFALAASLLISVISIGFSGYLYLNVSADSNLVAEQSSANPVDLIENSYRVAKAAYLTELATDKRQLTPEMRKVLRKNLEIIDQAASEIHAALKISPNDIFLMDTLIQTRDKEIELLRQVASQPTTAI